MTPPAIAPPPRSSASAPPPASGDVPRLPVRIPLAGTRPARGPLVTRRALAGSLAAHLLLALAVVLVPRREAARAPATAPAPGAEVAYLDLNDFPGAGGAASAAPAGAEASVPAPSFPDSAAAPARPAAPAPSAPAAPRPQPDLRFPTRAPTGIPGVPATPGGRPGAPAAPGANAGGGQGGAPSGPPGAAGGRLAPGYRDPRLYTQGPLPADPPKTDLQRYRERLESRIATYNDSVAAEAEAERRARDWTFRGRDGKRYGIDENGRAVVGGRTIPIPVAPPLPRSHERDDEARKRSREREELDRQTDGIQRDRNFRERTRAIRERQDSIRNARRGGSGSTP